MRPIRKRPVKFNTASFLQHVREKAMYHYDYNGRAVNSLRHANDTFQGFYDNHKVIASEIAGTISILAFYECH